jgi:hypothetical protein
MLRWFTALCAIGPTLAMAQSELTGPDRFPQFRVLSGLPGCGFGVTQDGVPSIRGALSFTTPIGYSLGARRFAVSFGSVSYDMRIRSIDSGGSNPQGGGGNGTLSILGGFEIPKWGRFTLAHTYLSSIGDNVQSIQWQLPLKDPRIGVSIGLQDIAGTGASSGENLPGDGAISRSAFLVGTAKIGDVDTDSPLSAIPLATDSMPWWNMKDGTGTWAWACGWAKSGVRQEHKRQ